MSSKVNISDVVKDHFKTLVNARTGKHSAWDIIFFYIIPLGVAAIVWQMGALLNPDIVSVLVTSLAIFAGLLLNLLLLTHSIIKGSSSSRTAIERQLLQEIYANISYSILISLITLVLLVLVMLWKQSLLLYVGSLAVYGLLGHFLLTLLMVLKRVHVLLGQEYKRTD